MCFSSQMPWSTLGIDGPQSVWIGAIASHGMGISGRRFATRSLAPGATTVTLDWLFGAMRNQAGHSVPRSRGGGSPLVPVSR